MKKLFWLSGLSAITLLMILSFSSAKTAVVIPALLQQPVGTQPYPPSTPATHVDCETAQFLAPVWYPYCGVCSWNNQEPDYEAIKACQDAYKNKVRQACRDRNDCITAEGTLHQNNSYAIVDAARYCLAAATTPAEQQACVDAFDNANRAEEERHNTALISCQNTFRMAQSNAERDYYSCVSHICKWCNN